MAVTFSPLSPSKTKSRIVMVWLSWPGLSSREGSGAFWPQGSHSALFLLRYRSGSSMPSWPYPGTIHLFLANFELTKSTCHVTRSGLKWFQIFWIAKLSSPDYLWFRSGSLSLFSVSQVLGPQQVFTQREKGPGLDPLWIYSLLWRSCSVLVFKFHSHSKAVDPVVSGL